MQWLREVAKLISVEQLLGHDLNDPLQVAITFDDGYASLHDVALPILKDHGAVATVFANTNCLATGETRKRSDAALGYYPDEFFLTWRDLLHLAAEGWSIGSHGMGHLDLTAINEDTAFRELTGSKNLIEGATSVSCSLFAYTWGRHTVELHRLVAAAGYSYGFSGQHGPVQLDSDALAVPRINVSNEYTIDDFKSIVRGDWDYLGWIQRAKGL